MNFFDILKNATKIAEQQNASSQFLKAECFPKNQYGKDEKDIKEIYISFGSDKGTFNICYYHGDFFPPIIGPPVLGLRSFSPLIDRLARKSLTEAVSEYHEMTDESFSDVILWWSLYPDAKPCYLFRTVTAKCIVIDFYQN